MKVTATNQNIHFLALGLLLSLVLLVFPAGAASMSASASAPVVDSKDIANYGAVTWTDKWFNDAAASGRPHGQTFSIGDSGVMLNAITYQVSSGQRAEETKTYIVRVGMVDVGGASFTEIHSENATQTFTWNGGEYMTWTLDTPVYLAPNTAYGVDIGMTSTTSGWQTGIPYLNSTEDVFAGGTSYLSGTTGLGIGDGTLNSMNKDRVFHLDLDDPMAPSPYDGEIVSGGTVNLSWSNLPANVGSDVWVDVWFGTDPGAMSKVVDAGQNVSSTSVSAPVADTYYWRVDSYLEGSSGGTPVESALFTFIVEDTDGDGLPDSFELAYTSPPSNTSMTPGDDDDSDGMTNLEEYLAGSEPDNDDTDGDTLLDGAELAGAGARPATDPINADTDGDGLDDGVESNTGTFVSAADTGTDPTNTDTDADALMDGVETGTGTFASANDTGTDPNNPDTDGDAAGDWYEVAATFTDPTDAGDDPGFTYPLPDPDPADTGVTNKPIKVYIMSGQSNMVGIGYVNEPLNGNPGSLVGMTRDENKFPHFVDDLGAWTERNDVWYEGVISADAKKWLSAGCGASSDRLGPELGFGHILGEYHDEPVLLIKSSIGNRSLSWDYCPPGTPQFTWNDGSTNWTYAGYGDSPERWETGTTPTPIGWYAGKQYDDCLQDEADWAPAGSGTVDNVVDVLDDFAARFPQYAAQGFEIAGYVWWQGHKDQAEPHASRYGQNMANFINVTRAYYENRYPSNIVPDAPFVLGTVSFDGGWANTTPGFLAVANGQLSVSGETGNYPEFSGNVLTVETRSYWRELADSPGSQGFHYNNNAETYTLVGDALGRGMVNMIEGNQPTLDTDPPAPDPASFATAPTAVNSVSVTMTATTGSDETDPVQYLFTETSGNPGGSSSNWQTSPTYTDDGLDSSTQYTYTVTMRDSAATPNVGVASNPANVTTDGPDTDPPTPNPPAFASAPSASGSSASMTSVVGTDATGPVEYFFTETSGNPGGTNSGWQLSPSYADNGLAPNTQYTYTVTMRDSLGNVSTASTGFSVTTDPELPAGGDAVALAAAFDALVDHLDGTTVLTGPQIAVHKSTIDSKSGFIGTHSSAIAAGFALVQTYDSVIGPIFVEGSPVQTFGRTNSDEDLNWVVYTVMQYIMDNVYTLDNVLNYDYLFEGFKFGSSDFFPGHAAPPVDPDAIYTVSIDASYPDTYGDTTMYTLSAARRPTGAYVAPGATAKITVPASIVGRGYNVRVGAHSWDFSNKPTIKRLDRVSRVFSIDDTVVEVASPLGGGIYIEVPHQETEGVIEVEIRNAIRAPYFSAKSFHTTTLSEWQNVERHHPAPWADFQSEKFMMNVPTDWIYAMDDPVTLMANHDLAMDAIDDLMGYPAGQGKETMYPQVDLSLRASVFAPGYPSVNMSYNPDASYGGDLDYFLLRAPEHASDWYYHEEGHAYGFPKFGGESESTVNLLHAAVANGKFGVDMDTALAASRGYQNNPHRTLDNTAIAWMTSFNFSPRNVPMASGEKSYQLKGHAKYVDIARLFGWGVLGDFWFSYNEEIENEVTSDTSNDGLMLRLAESVGVDVSPLLHFWGIQPNDPVALAASIATASLPESAAIYDTLVHYKSIVPTNNAAFQTFALNWWGTQPNPTAEWTQSEHGRQWDSTPWFEENNDIENRPNGEIYVEASATDIQAYVQTILDLYFPNGRPGGGGGDVTPPTPNPASFAVAPAAVSESAISMTATTGSDASGPVEYLFAETSGNPGGTSSGWQSSASYTDSGLDPSTQYSYTVTLRDAAPVPNIGSASSAASATTNSAPGPGGPVAVAGVTGHDGGNWPASLGHLTDMVNGANPGSLGGDHSPGMDISADPTDPSTWLYSGSDWRDEWKANSRLAPGTSANGKIGWASIDLGSVTTDLETLYLWNVRHQHDTENVATYNIYYADSPVVSLPATPNSQSTTGDYDFSSGGWTLFNGGGALSLPANASNNNTPQGAVALGGISARYLGIEILTAGGAASRVGLAQVEVTAGGAPPSVTVPDVLGLVQAAAESNVTAANLTVGNVTSAYSDLILAGHVMGQNPVGGATASQGVAVDLVISLGIQMVTVPDVVGLDQATAEADLVAAQLVAGTVTSEYSDTVPTGDVISQNPISGTSVVHDSPVDLVISLGEEPDTDPPTPDPAGFASVPTATSHTEITMIAISGTDDSGPVEYLFIETSGNPGGASSAWQANSSYSNSGLDPSTQYTYTVTMRDSLGNTGTASAGANATTDPAPDTAAPAPDPMTFAVAPAPASAPSVVFSEDFESPAVSGYVQGSGPAANWIRANLGFGSDRHGLYNEDTAGFSTSFGAQAYMLNYTNSGLTTTADLGVLTADLTYTVSFHAATESAVNAAQGGSDNYQVELVAFDGADNRADTDGDPAGTILATATGSVSTNDMSESFSVEFTASAGDPNLGKFLAIRLRSGGTHNALIDNVQLSTGSGAGGDSDTEITMTATAATDPSGVEYFFTETSGNPGGSDSVWQDSPVYTDSGLTPGTQYTYTVTARDKSPAQNATAPSVAASATTTGSPPDTTPPTLASSDIADDQGGGPVTRNTLVTYTVTFSEDMDEATVEPADFSNAGSSASTIGSVIEISPGVFTVEVTATDVGTLQLQVSAGAVLSDAVGNPLDTGAAISDDTTLTVDPIMVTVPDVVGLAQAAAESSITGATLTVGTVTTDYSDTVPAGDVISQSPVGSTSVAEGSAVGLTVSLGVQMVTVPNVVGLAQAAAESAITGAILTVGNVTTEYSATVPAGDVISQGLSAGASVPHDSVVDLTVSLGLDLSPKLVRTTVNGVSNSSWTTVSLGQTYNSAVIVATPIYATADTTPVATRITNVTSTGFDLKIDRADGLTDPITIDVSVIAVDEGVYTQAVDGVTMEAVKYTSTVTARRGSWVADSRSYQNSYTTPVVVGQIMSANDPSWSAFWSMGSSRGNPVDASNLNVGKHVAEDSNQTRADETIGYIVIESGSGAINGVAYEAALGADTVRGFGNSSSPYTYALSGGLSSASSAAASISGMDGTNGAWAVLAGDPALSTTSIGLYACEDQIRDSEQSHATTQVAYIVFE